MRISDWSSDVCSSDLTDGLDVLLQPGLAQFEHLLRRGDPLEEGPRGIVHADVGRLRGEHHGDQQGVGVHVLQLALGLREWAGKESAEVGGRKGLVGTWYTRRSSEMHKEQ